MYRKGIKEGLLGLDRVLENELTSPLSNHVLMLFNSLSEKCNVDWLNINIPGCSCDLSKVSYPSCVDANEDIERTEKIIIIILPNNTEPHQ